MADATNTPGARRRTGRRVALAMLILWVLIVIAVYVVIVRLKMGGEEGIRTGPPAVSPETSP